MHFSDKNKPQFTKAHQNKLPKNKIKIENNSGKLFTKIPGIFMPPKNYSKNAGIQQQGSKQ